MGSAVRFKHLNVPRQQGEQARLKVVQGPDFGAVYVITGSRSTLGRGEENDIMVSDLKASRKHAEFVLAIGGWTVKDLGSANGLLHNGKVTRSAKLQTGDSVTFGETTLEFITADAGTLMLVAPPRAANQLQADHAALAEQKKNVRKFGGAQSATSNSSPEGLQGLLQNRKLLLYLGVGAVALFVFLSDQDSAKKTPKKRSDQVAEDLSKYLPGVDTSDKVTAKTADQFFRAGFREYLEHNYLRAKVQFETVLQMSPGHPLATLYLENCETAMKDEVKFHLEQGKKSMESGKLKESKAHFEATLRILFRDQSNPAYSEAKDQLEKVTKEIIGEKGY